MVVEEFSLSKKYNNWSNTILDLDKEQKKKYFHKDKNYGDGYATFYFEEDVKEFIKRMKVLIESSKLKGSMTCDGLKIMAGLKTLAGDELYGA